MQRPVSRLYADLPATAVATAAEPPAKRVQTATSTTTQQAALISADPESASSGEPLSDDEKLLMALGKIRIALGVEAKFGKACAMLTRAMEALTVDTAARYVQALRATQEHPAWILAPAARAAVATLFKLVLAQRGVFPGDLQADIETWALRGISHANLFSDDSFTFAAAAKQLEHAVSGALLLRAHPAAAAARWEAILDCLATTEKQYQHSWARAPADVVLAAIVEQRHMLNEAHRERFDDLANKIRARKRPGAGNGMNMEKQRSHFNPSYSA